MAPPTTAELDAARQRRVALAVGYYFALSGFVFGSWSARLADIKERLDASPGPLGAAMLGTGLGGMLATAIGPAVIRRTGSRSVLVTAAAGACVLVVASAWAPSLVVLAPLLFLFGVCGGAMAIAFSAEALAYEQRVGHPIVNRFHGCHSGGGLAGALLGAAAALVLSPILHLSLVAVAAAIGLVVVASWLPGRADDLASTTRSDLARSSTMNRRLATVSMVAWCAAFAETAVISWSAVHLREGLGASSAVAALGFAALAAAMVTVRSTGSALLRRHDPRQVLCGAGWITAGGALVVAAAPSAVVAIIGCALVGGGVALVFPTATAAAGNSQFAAHRGVRMPSDAFALAVLLGGTGAQLAGPLLGAVAEVTTLRVSFAVVGLTGVVIALGARRLPTPAPMLVLDTVPAQVAVAA